jgi:hypothetical protein
MVDRKQGATSKDEKANKPVADQKHGGYASTANDIAPWSREKVPRENAHG